MINSLEIQGENCSTKTSFDIIKIICICSFYVTEYIYYSRISFTEGSSNICIWWWQQSRLYADQLIIFLNRNMLQHIGFSYFTFLLNKETIFHLYWLKNHYMSQIFERIKVFQFRKKLCQYCLLRII